MKILMFGRGVIATQYGWAFQQAGHSVEYYVRPGRVAELGATLPISLLDARTKMKGILVEETLSLTLREDIPADHEYELMVVSVQHYQFSEVAAFLAPKIGKATVLLFSNFWKDPQQQAAPFPTDQLVWGFPQAGGGFDANGVLKGALFADVHFGTFGTDPTARGVAVRDLFTKTGFKRHEYRDFKGWLWIHFVINAGFFATVLKTGSVDNVFRSSTQVANAVHTVKELLTVVEQRGINLDEHRAETALYRRPAWLASLLIRFVVAISPPLKRFLYSFNNVREEQSYCRAVLEEAHRLTVSVPRLEAVKPYLD